MKLWGFGFAIRPSVLGASYSFAGCCFFILIVYIFIPILFSRSINSLIKCRVYCWYLLVITEQMEYNKNIALFTPFLLAERILIIPFSTMVSIVRPDATSGWDEGFHFIDPPSKFIASIVTLDCKRCHYTDWIRYRKNSSMSTTWEMYARDSTIESLTLSSSWVSCKF